MAVLRLEDGSALAYPTDRSAPLITWEQWPEELRAEVPAETIDLFADGTVRVTYPEFRRFAGVYERKLSSDEFTQLLTNLALSGLASSDGRELQRTVAELERQDMPAPTSDSGSASFDYRTSETITVVRTRVRIQEHDNTATTTSDFAPHVFRYRGLETDAARHPDHDELQMMKAIQSELLTIATELVQNPEGTP